MPATEGRDALLAAILAFVGGKKQDLLALEDIRVQLERELDRAGDTAILALMARLTEDHGCYSLCFGTIKVPQSAAR